jgi:hypothetical protein
MNIDATTISLAIAIISGVIAIVTIIDIIVKIKNSKNITIKKSNGETITISKTYDRQQSKKLIQFMK